MDFKTWNAQTVDGPVTWDNSFPWVFALNRASMRLKMAFNANEDQIAAAHLGPYFDFDLSNPYAVAIMIRNLWPDAVFSADAPDLEAIIPALEDGAVN